MKKVGKFIKKNPVQSTAVGLVLAGVGYVGLKGYLRTDAFKKAALGDVNAMAAQNIGEMLPMAWKQTTWIARNVLPSSFFKAAAQVEEFFRSNDFKSKIFAITDTVTDKGKFEAYFKSMWGFSFFEAVTKNLPTADANQVYQNMSRDKITTSSSASEKKGLYMISSKTITSNDVAVVINGGVFGINKPIPANMVLGLSDGRSLTQGKVREGYVSSATYKTQQATAKVAVIVDKTKVKFLTAAEVARQNLKQVPISYIQTR